MTNFQLFMFACGGLDLLAALLAAYEGDHDYVVLLVVLAAFAFTCGVVLA